MTKLAFIARKSLKVWGGGEADHIILLLRMLFFLKKWLDVMIILEQGESPVIQGCSSHKRTFASDLLPR